MVLLINREYKSDREKLMFLKESAVDVAVRTPLIFFFVPNALHLVFGFLCFFNHIKAGKWLNK
jgi:hypothetical protein